MIRKNIRENELENNLVLPYRGTIHNMDLTLTYTRINLKQFLQIVPTPEIAGMTYNIELDCDLYIKAVNRSYSDRMICENIAAEQDIGKSLVRENIEIIEENRKLKEARNDKSAS